ncbi:MAG: response regulator [bacterium]
MKEPDELYEDGLDVKFRILVVDDADSMRELYRTRFLEWGYEATTAPDGETAVEKVKKEKYDLALVDLVMPGMDGIETIKEIKKHSPGTVTIILTAHGRIDTAVEAMKVGAFHYLEKTSNMDLVKMIVVRGLEKKVLTERTRIIGEVLATKKKEHMVEKIKEIKQELKTVSMEKESLERELEKVRAEKEALEKRLASLEKRAKT